MSNGPDCEPDAAKHRIVPSPETCICSFCGQECPEHESSGHYDSESGETFVSCGKCRGESHSHDVPSFMRGMPLEMD
jgi:hypothetical protein